MTKLTSVLSVATLLVLGVIFRRAIRQTICAVYNGGHEDYVVFGETEMYHECVGCGRRTSGWDVTPDPRFKGKVKNV